MNASSPASVSEDGGDRKATQKSPVDPNRACKVCGDKANGYNFGVLTCESCKAFFRRNAAKEHEITCPFSNSCGITPASRRYCQACRLKKCFSVGMSREWLLDQKSKPEATRKRLKKEEIEQTDSEEEISVSKAYLKELMRKAKGRSAATCVCTCTCGFYPSGTKLAPNMTHLIRPTVATNLPLVSLPSAAFGTDPSAIFPISQNTFSTLSSPGPSAFSPLTLNGPLSCDSSLSTEPRISAEEYARLLQMSRNPLTTTPTLTRDESETLQELIRVAQPLNSPLDMSFGDSNQLSLLDVVKITEYAMRRIVCMARDLSDFKSLPIEDRKTLMKGCSSELLILRGVMAFDAHKNMWLHSFSQGVGAMEVKLEVLHSVAEQHPQHYEEHKRFLESIDNRVRKKETVILVLMAILVFQPERVGLSSVGMVRASQNRYLNLLRRLLAVEFGEIEAPSMFTRLQINLRELSQLNQSMVRVYYGFDQRQLDPLIKELFDM